MVKFSELKTLKDLQHPQMRWKFINRNKLVSVVELQNEAKKWIKYYCKRMKPKPCKCGNLLNEYEVDEANYKIEFINKFFNI